MSEIKTDSALLSQNLLNAQVGVLGSMLIDDTTVGQVMQTIRSSDFTEKQYLSVFMAIQHLFASGSKIDPVTVNDKLGGQYSKILLNLMELTPTAANVDAYIDLLKQSSGLLHLQDLGIQMSTAVTLDDAQAILDKMFQMRVSKPGVERINMEQGLEQFFDRHDGEKKPEYISWGVPVLDERIFAEPGDLVVLGGYPSAGKTALARQFAAGIGKGHRVGYYSFESTKEKLFDRYVANAAMLSYTKIKRNELKEADYSELLALQDKLVAPQVDTIDAAGMTVFDIQADSQAHHYDVVFVDYLQKCAAPRGFRMTEFDRVSSISTELQQFGRLTKTTVIALSQLSRPEKDKRSGETRPPSMSDLRSSGQIEQDADVVLLLYREKDDDKLSNRILRIAKNKEGEALDMVRFKFDGDHQTFSRIAPDSHYQPKEPERTQRSMFDKDFKELPPDPQMDKIFPPDGKEPPACK